MAISTHTLEEIFDTLERELQSSDQLLELLAEEQIALTGMDIPSLLAISQRKQHEAGRLQEMDGFLRQRLGECRDGKAAAGDGAAIDLAALAAMVDDPLRRRLLTFRHQLGDRRRRIGELNHINHRLVADSLAYIDDAVRLLTGAATTGYGRTKRQQGRGPAFISRAV